MTTVSRASSQVATQDTLAELLGSFEHYLEAGGKSTRTRYSYVAAIRQLSSFLDDLGVSTQPARITPQHLEMFLGYTLGRTTSATANNRHHGLRAFFAWLVDDGLLRQSPMLGLRPPRTGRITLALLEPEQLNALISCASGAGFQARRDEAIIRLFADTGIRPAVLADFRHSVGPSATSDVDLAGSQLLLRSTRRRTRTMPFSTDPAHALRH